MSCELTDEGTASFSSLASQGKEMQSSVVLSVLLGGCFCSDLLTMAGTWVDCEVPFHWRCGEQGTGGVVCRNQKA